ncbi:MAG TPA: hypothetical protein VMW66_02625 [Elusimicrobiales bacterium]|nr:hypothetical protein [Elusimicrobiales bacterium]
MKKMRIFKLLPIIAAVFALANTLTAKTVSSPIANIRFEVPESWMPITVTHSGDFLVGAGDKKSFIHVSNLPGVRSAQQLKQRAISDRDRLIKQDLVTGRLNYINLSSDTTLYYVDFEFENTSYTNCYFGFEGNYYSCKGLNIPRTTKINILSSISPKEKEEPQAVLAQEQIVPTEKEPAPQKEVLGDEQLSTSESKPQPSEGVEDPSATVKEDTVLLEKLKEKLSDFTLPEGTKEKSIFVLIILGSFLILTMIVKSLFPRRPLPPDLSDGKTGYPIKFDRVYFNLSRVYAFTSKVSRTHIATKYRRNFTLILSSFIFVFAVYPLLKYVYHNHLPHNVNTSAFYLNALIAIFALALLFILIAFLRGLFVTSKIVVRDKKERILCIARKRHFLLNLIDTEIYVRDARGKLMATFTRFKLNPLKCWKLMSWDKNAAVTMRETSVARSIFRRLFGHCWGALRADYNLTVGGKKVGQLLRLNKASNEFALDAKITRVDPLVVAVLAICADTYSPDRWHPWFS